jgi:hypothetical protein
MSDHDPRFPYRNELEMPVIGLESEFKVFIDDEEVTPEEIWRTPAAFIDRPLLRRTSKSSQLPTGGAVYFDGGVVEVVTPVIEIAPQCTGRAVRSLWEQIGFVRDQLDRWEESTGRTVRLQAFSCHFNISFELARSERNRDRTIQKLALLLTYLLPVPVSVAGANRKSTGIGVRPRRDRIEITFDFTPDPGLMAATAALLIGIVRDVISWRSYRIEELAERGIPIITGVTPGKHPSRNGWVMRDYHFPQSPYTASLDAPIWNTIDGPQSLRDIALGAALVFSDSIRRYSDPFSFRLLFSILRGETVSLLDLADRPAAYDDVGRSTRWGTVLPELENFAALMNEDAEEPARASARRRRSDVEERLSPPWRGETPPDRRQRARGHDRRREETAASSPRLTRSVYEKVFLKLGNGKRLKIGDEILTPVAVKGWYHSIFVNPEGEERMLSIDQILQAGGQWRE